MNRLVARLRPYAQRGQFDPIWMLAIMGVAIVLSLLVWKYIIPPIETMIQGTGQHVNCLNYMMGQTQSSGQYTTTCP